MYFTACKLWIFFFQNSDILKWVKDSLKVMMNHIGGSLTWTPSPPFTVPPEKFGEAGCNWVTAMRHWQKKLSGGNTSVSFIVRWKNFFLPKTARVWACHWNLRKLTPSLGYLDKDSKSFSCQNRFSEGANLLGYELQVLNGSCCWGEISAHREIFSKSY